MAAIGRHLDSLLVTCAEEQQLPLQSISSLIDDSFCLKEGSALTLNMSNYSKYQKSDGIWYSPPFYLGDIAGIDENASCCLGIKEGVHTHNNIVYLGSKILKEMKIYQQHCSVDRMSK